MADAPDRLNLEELAADIQSRARDQMREANVDPDVPFLTVRGLRSAHVGDPWGQLGYVDPVYVMARLNPAVSPGELTARSIGAAMGTLDRSRVGRAAAEFVGQFLKEIRRIICTESHGGLNLSDYRTYPKAVAIALASEISRRVGFSDPMALGVATLMLLSLGQATKNAFCAMTDDAVVLAIKDERST